MSLTPLGCGTSLIFFWYLSQIAFAFASNSDFERRAELLPPPLPQPASSAIDTIARAACLIATGLSIPHPSDADVLDRLELLERLPAAVAIPHAATGSRA